jgi:small subunit ribosomal protein S4
MAMKSRGVSGLALLQILESRFDNVVCRLGLGSTRAEARQLIKHSHFTVNGKKVNIPSYLLSEGDVIEVRERSKKIETIKAVQEDSRPLPSWLEVDKEKMLGKVISKPGRDEIDLPVKEHYIIELYSKN